MTALTRTEICERKFGSIAKLRTTCMDSVAKEFLVRCTELFHCAKERFELPSFHVSQLEGLENDLERVMKRVK